MKRIALSLILCCSAFCGGALAQNGPTQHSVKLQWTQSSSTGVTANCVYRGATLGNYLLPALFCSTAPITSYIDTSVVGGQTYHYAVTAQVSGTESGYSNDVTAAIPTSPLPPTGLTLPLIAHLKKLPKPPKDWKEAKLMDFALTVQDAR